MKLKLPGSSARARTVIVAGTFLGAIVTGGWLLQRGSQHRHVHSVRGSAAL